MKIQIYGLTVYSYIGIHCWERVLKQRLIIDCELTLQHCDIVRDIGDTVDYKLFSDKLVNFTNLHHFSLLETMASDLLAYIMTNKKIYHCYLKVHKPLALGMNGNVSVILESINDR